MNEFMSTLRRMFIEQPWYVLPVSLGILTTGIGLGMYAYLGTFSRYGSDDYCLSAFFLQGDLTNRLIERHMVTTGRYTNILFIGLADTLFGWYNVAVLPPLLIVLFVIGLFLVLRQLEVFLAWGWDSLLAFFMAGAITYFSVLQAPHLYETFYWRAGMTSHFAPLAFLLFLGVFWLRQAAKPGEAAPPVWIQVVSFLGPFLVGGLSEPPTAMMITILALALAGIWWWRQARSHRYILTVLSWSLAGAVLALLLMATAPANSLRLGTPPPGIVELVARTARFPFEFIFDTLRTLPTPTIVSFALPAVLLFVKFFDPTGQETGLAPRRIGLLVPLVALLAYVLIAATFAPSVYGQSYPVARARFAGRLLMTSALIVDGALLGMLAAGLAWRYARTALLHRAAAILLLLLMLYPLRSVARLLTEVPRYQERAAAWDRRDSRIRALQAQGERDLVVRFLPNEQIQDLGDHTGFRLNRCASLIYGVDSIVAVPMVEE